ncbi:MAG: AAA family ATPase [Gammaproteobacteria bacterium]|nr:AAA family ATPase [Gammaproteobacteria bacterium]
MKTETRPWWIYQGHSKTNEKQILSASLRNLGKPPPWRQFDRQARQALSTTFEPEPSEIDRVNAALLLRRPLLITGKPGVGKTSLTYAVAHELGLEPVLRWSITSRSVLQDGLYRYDAIGRLQETQRQGAKPQENDGTETVAASLDIGNYLSLGPLGTAFAARKRTINIDGENREITCPRVLLIDEIDKSDIDLPNDLLHLFEEGAYQILELARLKSEKGFDIRPDDYDEELNNNTVHIEADGWIYCKEFPLVVMTGPKAS